PAPELRQLRPLRGSVETSGRLTVRQSETGKSRQSTGHAFASWIHLRLCSVYMGQADASSKKCYDYIAFCPPVKRKEGKMGLTKLTVRIVNPADPRRYRDVELIVDSGEHFAVVPREILKELGIRPRRKRSFVLANGEKFERKMGNAEFEY